MISTSFFKTIKRIYSFLPSQLRRATIGVTFLSAIVALVELAIALVVSLLGVVLTTPDAVFSLKPVVYLQNIFPQIQPYLDNQRTLLVCLLGGIIFSFLIKLCISEFLYWKQGQLAERTCAAVGHVLFKGFLHNPYLWHVSQETSVLHTHLGWRGYVSIFMMQALVFVTYFSVGTILLASILVVSPLIGLFVISVTGVSAYLIFKSIRRKVHTINESIGDINLDLSRTTLSALSGIREVLIYRQQKSFLTAYDAMSANLCILKPQQEMLLPLPPMLLEIVGMVMLLLTVLYMNIMEVSLTYMIATLTLMAAVVWRLLPTMNRFIGGLLQAQAALPYIQHLFTRLDEIESLGDGPAITPAPCHLETSLTFSEVSFRYPKNTDGGENVLKSLSFVIPKGKKVGIIGSSGAGKSTVVGLVTGLFPPTQGTILLNDEVLSPSLRAGWMDRIGYVPQSTFLMNASIAENIAFSQWGEEFDREAVLSCCKMAAMDFIESLPAGIDTVVGERGVRLSGGQIQRISIARALYKKPDMLVFDEATSSLDGASEAEIMHTIEALDDSMTIVMVAHRLSTVTDCDHIYWLLNGEIFMQGSPDEVIPKYSDFLENRQQQGKT